MRQGAQTATLSGSRAEVSDTHTACPGISKTGPSRDRGSAVIDQVEGLTRRARRSIKAIGLSIPGPVFSLSSAKARRWPTVPHVVESGAGNIFAKILRWSSKPRRLARDRPRVTVLRPLAPQAAPPMPTPDPTGPQRSDTTSALAALGIAALIC